MVSSAKEITMITKVNWDEVPVEEVTPKMKRQILSGEKLMIARMQFQDGFVVPLHHHENEQITQVHEGKIHFWFGENREKEMILGPGDCVVIPAHLPHEALMIGNVIETDSWAPPRKDWLDGTDHYLRK